MSPTVKALLLELLAELVATAPQTDYELTQIFTRPAHRPQDLRDLAKRIREAKHDDVREN